MEKFSSSSNKTREKILFKKDNIELIDFEGWQFLKENDGIAILPYLIEENSILLRNESVPCFNYITQGERYLTIISGTIEDDENPLETVRRELKEEAGIELRDDYIISLFGPIFVSKSGTRRLFWTILPLFSMDFEWIKPEGDGTKGERDSSTIKIPFDVIPRLKPSTIECDWLLNKFLLENNISHLSPVNRKY